MGRGIGQGLKTAFEGQQFPTCARNATGSLLCDELTLMGPGDVTTVDGVFSFLHGGLAGLLWPPGENTTAAEALVANSLRVVGALKVRAQRVESVPSNFPNSFFEPIYNPVSVKHPPGCTSTAPLEFTPSAFVQSRVLMP